MDSGISSGICWVLSCSPAPIRSVSSVNLVEKGEVVLPPPDYLGAAQTDRRVEPAKGTAVKAPSDRAEQAGPVSAWAGNPNIPPLDGSEMRPCHLLSHLPVLDFSPLPSCLQGNQGLWHFSPSIQQEGRIAQGCN